MLLPLRKNILKNMAFPSFHQDTHFSTSIYYTSDQMPWWANTSNCGQRELGCRHQMVERTVDSVEDIPATWQCWHCYFLPDGRS
ncbi:uncharacterized protein LOC115158864 isoform X2 [Salmo trutta]|uniref:uncharacterized protein LOC115158864 isoform X2 n=1 Tax=Salmo trutta TaxID=8032 RepID=UPI0011316ED6|nr:uncharacterized protein LOC115158864 isoform X2 [Salmo trutta]